ncbi:tyrosine-type recombinase/integrase [Nonomuraea sp. NPDC046802]|uniref:tyrosine-type recombinase/integrase n=1 Tax=Nonomuraea sp. NPDC046802 TaxID=3154919 RepID=UPI0033D0B22A
MPKLIEAHNKQNLKAQLPHARLHDLRHVHTTTLLLVGVPVHVAAARHGHADPAITLRVYAHVIREQAATAAEIFAREVVSSYQDREQAEQQATAVRRG